MYIEAEEVLARLMAQEVRVLCMVMINTTKQTAEASHLKKTWGRHCNQLIFMSDENLKSLCSLTNTSMLILVSM